jgi:dTDP-4-dehydrorhamnose reductase
MLGQDLMSLLGERGRGVDLPDIDITDMVSVQQVLTALKPKVVINCAAYTDVDGCETNAETAMQVNGEGVAFLALVTRGIGAKLVQVSTDYVFDGSKGSPYREDDLQQSVEHLW